MDIVDVGFNLRLSRLLLALFLSVEPMMLSVVRWWHFMQLKLMQGIEKAKRVHEKPMTYPISYRSATVTHIAFTNEKASVHTVSYLTQQQTFWRPQR